MPLPAHITLTPRDDGETALYHDAQLGFAQALPGHPQLLPPDATPGEPQHAARVRLHDIAVEVRYHHQPVQATDQHDRLAQSLAGAYGFNRSGQMPEITPGWPQQVASWGVDGAASALYELKAPDAEGYDTEEVLVLVRGAKAMLICKRLKAEALGWLEWALFSSAANSAIQWRPGVDRPTVPALWPESEFLLPGVLGTLTAKQEANVPDLAALLAGMTVDLDQLADRFGTFILGSDPPWLEVTPAMRETFAHYLLDIVEHDDLQQVILHGLHDHVRTMHDLRGMGLVFLRAIDALNGMPLPKK